MRAIAVIVDPREAEKILRPLGAWHDLSAWLAAASAQAGRPVPPPSAAGPLYLGTLGRRRFDPGPRECANRLRTALFQNGLKAGLCLAPASSDRF